MTKRSAFWYLFRMRNPWWYPMLAVLAMAALALAPQSAGATSFGAKGKCVGWVDAGRSGDTTVSAITAVSCTAAVTSLGSTTFCLTHKVNGAFTTPHKCWWIMTPETTLAGGRTDAATPGTHEFCTIVARLGSTTGITGGCAYVTV